MSKKPKKMKLNSGDIKRQSEAAYNQWATQWREHATIHSEFEMHSMEELRYTGVGKPLLVVGNGHSLEENIEVIKEYADKVDIFCCDKTLGHLLERGIEPTYCMVCDANVNYEKYCEKYNSQLQNTILFMNVCGNPQWSKNGNWKSIYFFVNRDVLNSEKEFSELSGCKNLIPAATNVSNAMVVLATQADEKGRCNFLGYDKYLLIGFDYSWLMGGSYYAFDKDGGGKHNYMRHGLGWDSAGNFCYTSNNLLFSAKWLNDYVNAFQLPVVQCGKEAVSGLHLRGELEKQLGYNYKPDDAPKMKSLHDAIEKTAAQLKKFKKEYTDIFADHENHMAGTI